MTLSPAPAAVAAVAACSCCAYAVWKLHAERSRFASERQRLEAQAAKALRLRAEERAGRTTAERRLRQQLQQSEAARRDRGGGDVGSGLWVAAAIWGPMFGPTYPPLRLRG